MFEMVERAIDKLRPAFGVNAIELVGVEEGESAEGGGCVGFHFSVSFDEDDVLQDAAGGFAVYTY